MHVPCPEQACVASRTGVVNSVRGEGVTGGWRVRHIPPPPPIRTRTQPLLFSGVWGRGNDGMCVRLCVRACVCVCGGGAPARNATDAHTQPHPSGRRSGGAGQQRHRTVHGAPTGLAAARVGALLTELAPPVAAHWPPRAARREAHAARRGAHAARRGANAVNRARAVNHARAHARMVMVHP
jgi:hypothetical protein